MKALLIVDVQNDFMPGGALGVPHGDEIVPVVNSLQEKFDLIVATKDWHPPGHISFASRHGKKPGETIVVSGYLQELWPDHCVQNRKGSEFPPSLKTDKIAHVVYKGIDPEIDSYSTFRDNIGRETGLAAYFKENGVDELYIVGLATDYCVRSSVHDALLDRFKVTVIEEGCRGIGDTDRALKDMKEAGARIL
ncbi:MAG: bifunctional nicotinamidase/pyrazinamidase [Chlamydiales bacterium]|nr:bifunctional nicotinamidase/pyrazinamidase [Chlamydiales bacterium]